MAVTITSNDERESIQLDLELPRHAKRLVLVDADGCEYHFGCGAVLNKSVGPVRLHNMLTEAKTRTRKK